MKFIPLNENKAQAIVCENLSKEEFHFIENSLRIRNLEVLLWENLYGFPELHPNQVIVLNRFATNSIQVLSDWSVETSIVGRLDENKTQELKNSPIVSFWNLEKNNIEQISPYILKKIAWEESPELISWTEDLSLNERIRKITKYFSCDAISTSNHDYALLALKENHFDILVLDWDYSGMEIAKLIRELRIIKTEKDDFPLVLGIKDFDKMDIFKNLSSGMREFSSVLFNKTEVLSTLLQSFPIYEKKQTEFDTEEIPLIQKSMDRSGKNIYQLDYEKENSISRKSKLFSNLEIDLFLFKTQFLWLLEE
ncbi:MAG: hypothetical protein SFU98_17620 [Leptospiraceae bacterium]|nr:hypothetical protein [Leptospiraceae bacterium]